MTYSFLLWKRYENPETIANKLKYVIKRGMPGGVYCYSYSVRALTTTTLVLIWAVDLDKNSQLINAVRTLRLLPVSKHLLNSLLGYWCFDPTTAGWQRLPC
jgi:hypothetical protein